MLVSNDNCLVKHSKKNIFAMPQPDGNGYQVSYEFGNSRKVHRLSASYSHDVVKPPHGAGSYHDPEQHMDFMKCIEDYINNSRS